MTIALGRQAMLELVAEAGDVGGFLSRQLAGRKAPTAAALLSGAVSALIEVVARLKDAGIKVSHGNALCNEFMRQPTAVMCAEMAHRLNQEPDVALKARLEALAGVAVTAQRQGLLNFSKLAQPQAAAPAVQRVEIVALPDRVTTTVIDRDSDGNISESRQLERDAT